MQTFNLCIPTLNAERHLAELLPAIRSQTARPKNIIIVDSSSSDDTALRFKTEGATVITIPRELFDHGGSRNIAFQRALDADVALFLTQDAVPATPDSFQSLVAIFEDAKVGVAYGRQLPRQGAGLLERHAREFNYGPDARRYTSQEFAAEGVKAIFCSNSFAAYRTVALQKVGGFPDRIIASEDHIATARLLKAGWHSVYVPQATVWHSHEYSLSAEFRRYFDIGVTRSEYEDVFRAVGSARSTGTRFLTSQLQQAAKTSPLLLWDSIASASCKFLGYELGRRQHFIPRWLKRALSMHSSYWNDSPAAIAATRPEQQM